MRQSSPGVVAYDLLPRTVIANAANVVSEGVLTGVPCNWSSVKRVGKVISSLVPIQECPCRGYELSG